MGTTRIKVIDLSSQQQEIATSRKRARLASRAKLAERVGKVKEGAERIENKEPASQVAEGEPRFQRAKRGEQRTKNKGIGETEETEEIKDTVDSGEKPAITEGTEESEESTRGTKSTKGTKSTEGHRHHQGKNYLRAQGQIDKDKVYPVSEALALLGKTSYTSFDPTVEVHFRVMDKSVRGTVKLPHPLEEKKQRRILVFSDKPLTTGDQHIILGEEKTIGEIESGRLKPGRDFDLVVASPKFMPQLAKVAKILGPKGMMPNPKNGTVTDDWQKFLAAGSVGAFQYKTDPTAPVIHTKIGKLSNKEDELSANLKALILAIGVNRIKKATITTTMGPGIKLDVATVSQ